MANLRLLIADDHTLFRQGLRKILEERPDWEVVAEADNGKAAARKAIALEPDVAVLDIGMSVLNGIDATRQIVRKAPKVRVLILSMYSDEAYVTRALNAGATGYVLKDSAGKDFIKAVTAVSEGTAFFSPAISRLMLDDYMRRAASTGVVDRYDTLSDREREIFQLVAEGKSNKEVAELLAISPATVETHRARVLQKLEIHNTAELVLYAVRRGVIA
ncbi:MAG: response regulator transcription factor [Vicinamibacterales bacterium]